MIVAVASRKRWNFPASVGQVDNGPVAAAGAAAFAQAFSSSNSSAQAQAFAQVRRFRFLTGDIPCSWRSFLRNVTSEVRKSIPVIAPAHAAGLRQQQLRRFG